MAKWSGAARGRIAAPIDKVWKIASDFGGIREWLGAESMRSCEIVQGENRIPGCVRKIIADLPGESSAEIMETLLDLDESNHIFKYKIESPSIPHLDGLCPTLRLSDLGDGVTEVDWSYEVDPDSDPAKEQQISRTVLGFYSAGIESLKKLVE